MYEKDSERRAWARDQMDQAKVPEQYHAIVEKLLDTYWPYAMENELTPAKAEELLAVFSELARGHGLLPEEEDEVWIDAKPGILVVRDTVRVKHDAYTGPAGLIHNGRRGVITAIRYGDIHVRYTDGKEPTFDFLRHPPTVLEKKIR